MAEPEQFHLFRTIPEEQAILRPWQERLFQYLVRLALIAGGAAAIPGIIGGVIYHKYAVVVVDVLAYGLVVAVAILRPKNYRISAVLFILAVLLTGSVLFVEVGLKGASMIWLFAPMVLVPLLLGDNVIPWAAGLVALILSVGSVVMLTGHLSWYLELFPWLAVLASFVAIAAFAVISIRYLLRRLAAALIQERELNAQLRKASNQNHRLLSEIHHRVQNSLQLVLSMLSLERSGNNAPETTLAYDSLERRVTAMALVYTGLRPADGKLIVDCRDLIDHMCRHGDVPAGTNVSCRMDQSMDSLELPLQQATPIALLLGELIRLHTELHSGTRMEMRFSVRSDVQRQSLRVEWTGSVEDARSDTLLRVLLMQLHATVRTSEDEWCSADLTIRSTS